VKLEGASDSSSGGLTFAANAAAATAADSSAGATVIAIVEGAFRMEENIRSYAGIPAKGPAGEDGQLVGPFGKLGKCKVRFSGGFSGPVGVEVEFLLANPGA
jgi:hypothetical protein